jgi:hypothetical protein
MLRVQPGLLPWTAHDRTGTCRRQRSPPAGMRIEKHPELVTKEVECYAMKCPNCGLLNPESAQKCDCGYDFLAQKIEPQSHGPAKRPKWVWVILVFYIVSAIFTLPSFALIYSGAVPLNAAQQEYFSGLGIFDFLFSIALATINLWGTVQLFRLRRSAVRVYTVALTLNVVLWIYHLAAKNFMQAAGASGLVGGLVGLGILAAILFYSRNLARNGILI